MRIKAVMIYNAHMMLKLILAKSLTFFDGHNPKRPEYLLFKWKEQHQSHESSQVTFII